MTDRRALALEALLVGVASVVAVVVLSWPLVPQLNAVVTGRLDTSDLGWTVLAQWWSWTALTGPEQLTHLPLVWAPEGQDVARAAWNLPVLLSSSVWHAVAEPYAAYNLSILATMVLNAGAFYLLGRRLGGRLGGALAAAVVLAMPYAWEELYQGRLEQGFLAPWALVGLALQGVRDQARWSGVWLGASMGLAAACYWFAGPMLALACPVLLGRHLKSPAVWRQVGVGVAVCAAVCAPFVLLTLPQLDQPGTTDLFQDDALALQFRVQQRWAPHHVVGWLADSPRRVGWMPLLALVGLGATQDRRWWGVFAVALVLAAGPVLVWNDKIVQFDGTRMALLPLGWFDGIPGASRFWWPYRFLALGVLAVAGGVASLGPRLPKWGWALPVVLLGEGLALQLRPVAVEVGKEGVHQQVWGTPPVGRFYAAPTTSWRPAQRDGIALTFPGKRAGDLALAYVPLHQHPIADGGLMSVESAWPAWTRDVVAENKVGAAWMRGRSPACGVNAPDALDDLRARGVTWLLWIVPHPDLAPGPRQIELDRQSCLRDRLGPPDFEDTTLVGWEL